MKLTINVDGGSRGNPGPAGAGVVIRNEAGQPVLEAGYFLGPMTNNMAEYQALIRGVQAAGSLGATEVAIFADSELLVRQLNGEYRVKNETLKGLFDQAFSALKKFARWKITHVRREGNSRADHLANMAMDAADDVVMSSDAPSPTGAAAKSDSPVIIARCTASADESVCPAPCVEGDQLKFHKTMPAGVCLHIAAELIDALGDIADGTPRVVARCTQAGCGATFDVTQRK